MPLLILLVLAGLPAFAEGGEEPDEWTVMFYFCGSDLESKYGYASDCLKQINDITYPDSYLPMIVGQYGVELDPDAIGRPPKVNVLVETGGSKAWHAQDLGMDIATDALQRWRYECASLYDDVINDGLSGFELLETLPLQSMSDPQTLSDFIRWGVGTCPAKKYALVLWDHGGGAKTGLFIDELFDGDVLYLYELKQALADGGADLEAVVIDACLMANLETAWNIKDFAHWMVASEEIVPGEGSAVKNWLGELFAHPECDGLQLGRSVCDMTQIKYANKDDEQARSILTWSVIDLSKIDRLAKAAERFLQMLGETYANTPGLTIQYATVILKAEEYGDGPQNMRDIAGVLYNPDIVHYLDRDLRSDMLDALSDAVAYTARGGGRSGARGLSFCYPVDFDPAELDIYALNCPSPHYLAFLDAVSDWTAPDWVYEQVQRLPELDTVEDFRLEAERKLSRDGFPGIAMNNLADNLSNVYCRLYRLDEETGQTLLMGRTVCGIELDLELGNVLWLADASMRWPAIEGVPCAMELILEQDREFSLETEYVYNIPVQIGTDVRYLRCGRVYGYSDVGGVVPVSDYEVYGVWEGYDETTEMTNRGVTSLSKLAGQTFQPLYPVDGGKNARASYQSGDSLTMYRALDVDDVPLPAGTYYMEYEVDDMFLKPFVLERVEMHWDGESLTFPEDFTWEGSTVLNQ